MPQLTELLLESADKGQLSGVLFALNNGTYPSACTDDGHTAMHLAGKAGHVDIVEELAKHGALVNAATHKGNTPLHGAAYTGQIGVCVLLVKLGANLEALNNDGEKPLDRARKCGQADVVEFLEFVNATGKR